MILLLLLSLVLLFSIIFKRNQNVSLSIIYTLITHALLVWGISEIFSLFDLFNHKYIKLFWSISVVTELIWILKSKEKGDKTFFFNTILKSVKSSILNNRLLFFILFVFFIIIFIQGIIYPPNNWDSLTYHMARIPHWIINENLNPYPTPIYRQIYSPPLSELIISHVCILNKSDYFANSVQLFFLLGVLVIINLFCNEFKLSKNQKLFVLIFSALTPSILLEASSTQNDIITSFFILSTIHFIYRFYKSPSFINTLLIGTASGLSCYTKGTSYIFLLPILIFWAILVLKKVSLIKTILINYSIAILSFLSINILFFYRNYQLSGGIFGKNDDRLFNETMSLKIFFVNGLKNVGNHLSIPKLNHFTNQFIEKIHLLLNLNINDVQTNFNGIGFKLLPWQHHEDTISNFIQLIILIISIFIFLKTSNRTTNITKLLFGLIIIELVLFNLLLKWQPWHTRLTIPVFFIAFLFLASLIKDLNLLNKTRIYFLVITLSIYGFILVLLNPTRPFITNSYTSQIKVEDNRFKKYCSNYLALEKDYKLAIQFIKEHPKETSLELGGDMWEYLFYKDVIASKTKFHPKNIIGIENQTKKLANPSPPTKYVISYRTEIEGYKKIRTIELFNFYIKTNP